MRRRPRSARVPDFATLTLRPAAAPPGIKMHTLPMTMPHEHRRRTEEAHGHKHNSECQKIEEEECKADAECKWEAGECVTALSDTDHLDFHATYKYVVEEGGMCAATYAAAVASHSVAFPPREPYMQPETLTTGFEAMRKGFEALSDGADLTAYLRAVLPSWILDADLDGLISLVIDGLVKPYIEETEWPRAGPLLATVVRSLGVPPVDIDDLLNSDTNSDDLATWRAKYASDFMAAMFADIQKGAVGQCDCETACAPLTSFQPDSFKSYGIGLVPPQWIWFPPTNTHGKPIVNNPEWYSEVITDDGHHLVHYLPEYGGHPGWSPPDRRRLHDATAEAGVLEGDALAQYNDDIHSSEFAACRAITVKPAGGGYTILDQEVGNDGENDRGLAPDATVRTPGRLRVRRAPRRPRADPPLPPAPGRVRVPGRRRVPPDHDRHVRAPHADEGPPPVVQVLEGIERVRARQPSAGGVRPVRHRLRGVEDGVRNLRYLVRQSLRRPGDAQAVRGRSAAEGR